jgi:ATP-dependent DNA helicase PIF1
VHASAGDFFQLPPVGLVRDKLKFLFEAACWHAAAKHAIVLREVWRQSDSTFVTLLNEMRRARLSPFSIAMLHHAVAAPPTLTLVPTRLFPHNATAEEHNLDQLTALPGRTRKFLGKEGGTMQWLLKDLLVPKALVLKEQARMPSRHLALPHAGVAPRTAPRSLQVPADLRRRAVHHMRRRW